MSNDLKPTTPNDHKWGMLMHMSALAGLLFPLGLVLGPFLVWFLKKNDSYFLNVHGKKAINFQLSILVVAFVVGLLSTIIRPLIAVAFMAGLAGIVFAIIAGISVNKGKDYKYPFSFKFIG